jgi:hypothetical protein
VLVLVLVLVLVGMLVLVHGLDAAAESRVEYLPTSIQSAE